MLVTPDNLKELLEAGISLNGAWNSAQLRILLPKEKFNPDGFPCCGWKQRLIGQKLSELQIDEFLRLKNRHLGHKTRILPGQREKGRYEKKDQKPDNSKGIRRLGLSSCEPQPQMD